MKYDFKCKNHKCPQKGKTVEGNISIKEEIKSSCKQCGGVMQRIYSAPAIKTSDGVKG